MNIFAYLKKKLLYKEHEVSYCGKKTRLAARRLSKETKVSARAYTDKNAVICGVCGSLMWPGNKIWLAIPKDKNAYEQPGILTIGEGEDRAMIACLSWGCPPTAALMCGELLENRTVSFFESPLDQAMRTGEVICVPSVEDYKGKQDASS